MGRSERADDKKFRELVLYIARRSEADPGFGATKLNKILFFCDFLAYRTFGRSITSHPYQKLEHGPAPRALKPILRRMVEEGDCVEVQRDHFGYPQVRIIARREPDLGLFSAEEIDLVGRVLEELRDSNATQVSELSHQFIGWQVANLNEDIPYATVFVGTPRPLTAEEIEYGRQLARELGE
jgi:hypothetical protein